jgi:galactose mutarotase-like enzyme
MSVIKTFYGNTNGKDVFAYTIENSNGTKAVILTLGATLDKLIIKNKDGVFTDVLVGHDDIDGHVNRSDYQGVVVGQFANRIKDGKFTIDGTQYNVTCNEKGITCLHGGGEYSSAIWDAIITDDNAVELTYFSPDGKEGFPGNGEALCVFVHHLSKNIVRAQYMISSTRLVCSPGCRRGSVRSTRRVQSSSHAAQQSAGMRSASSLHPSLFSG